MAFDCFLKIDGIPGESTDDKHKDWIEVSSYSWGAVQPASATASSSGGAATERADFEDFSVTKLLDKSSPDLALACVEGRHIKEVRLELCRAGGDKLLYMEYKMSNCIIRSVNTSGSSGGEPEEAVAINYGKIEWTYTQQKRADGTGGGKIAKGWNLEMNKKV
ncbi:MAG: Hcp family type VI secretion system effector [Desulfatiglandales bacterium]